MRGDAVDEKKEEMVALTLLVLLPCFPLLLSSRENEVVDEEEEEICEASLDCSKELQAGQFLCLHKDVDEATQQLRDCRWGKLMELMVN